MQTKYTTSEFAYTLNGIIYLHPALKEKRWRRLHTQLLEHEKKHLKGGNLADDLADLYNFVNIDTYLFCINHPETLTGLLPDTPFDACMILLLIFTLLAGWYINPITLLQRLVA